ncbi:hypothetical protein ACUN0C_05945 [Faunimonas sp. B44]|uniref:hypothetical protein n=1 Tax=Faunimonas sp. B44 TaxID=3461493 RepID=UPI004043F154
MSPALAGAFVGLAFAAVEYVMFGVLIARARERGEEGRGPRMLDLVRKVQLVLFPLIGFFAGPYVAGSLGVS